MSEGESDHSDYQLAKDLEGGMNHGRNTPGRGLLWTLGIAVALILLGALALAFISAK